MRWCRTIVLVCLLLGGQETLQGQAIRGVVVDEETGTPVVGAVVILLDEQAERRRAVLADESGTFHITAPSDGRYRLRAERIGYTTTTFPFLHLQAAQELSYRLAISSQPVELVGIEVTGRRQCSLRPEEGLPTHSLWEEVRKALDATIIAQEEQLLRVRLARYERELDPRGGEIRSERTWIRTGVSGNPFRSAPLEELAQHGFVRHSERGTIYHAPDAQVLLSDAFLETHCFRAVTGRDPELIGLAFEPHRSRRLPDVRGVLWVDRRTRELRHLEYHYTNLPAAIRIGDPGGRVEFQRLATGQWIVRRWRIRMPLTQRHEVSGPVPRRTEYVLAGIKEEGGEVEEALSSSGARLSLPGQAVLHGVVFDRTRDATVAGATVFLPGTTHETTSDSLGRFMLQDLPEGTHAVAFRHPRADSLGAPMLQQEVLLPARGSVEVELAIPTTASLLARVCSEEQRRVGGRALVGVVRATGSEQPVPSAEVILSAQRTQISGGIIRQSIERSAVTTDSEGRFQSCVAARGVSAVAVFDGLRGQEVRIADSTTLIIFQVLEVPGARLPTAR